MPSPTSSEEELIVCALLHHVGETLGPLNHGRDWGGHARAVHLGADPLGPGPAPHLPDLFLRLAPRARPRCPSRSPPSSPWCAACSCAHASIDHDLTHAPPFQTRTAGPNLPTWLASARSPVACATAPMTSCRSTPGPS